MCIWFWWTHTRLKSSLCMFPQHCNLGGKKEPKQVLHQEIKWEILSNVFFVESHTTWQLKRNISMQEQLALFDGGPLRIVSWISILQYCTSSQAAKEKHHIFFPPIRMLSSSYCSKFQASFTLKNYLYFEKSS